MIILPAIDICNGNCVRLYQGDFSTAEKVAENPLDTAQWFRSQGAKWLHMVDLDGAKHGTLANREIIVQTAKESGLLVELGGGIRDMHSIEYYLERGISRVILGSAAIKNPRLVKDAAGAYGEKIAVGIDALNGMVATHGWLQSSDMDYIELARRMEAVGVRTIIFTDIGRDGTLAGPNLTQLESINRAVSCDIIASGGVANLRNIKDIKAIGVYGAICGKSIYKGTLDLREAIKVAGEQTDE